MKHLACIAFFPLLLLSCSNTSGTTGFVQDGYSDVLKTSSASQNSSSSSSEDSGQSISWVTISGGTWVRGVTRITQTSFLMTQTEITQELYESVMDTLPVQLLSGDSLPVANVTWYEAALFCNALSSTMGLDTAYSYSSIGPGGVLLDVAVDYTIESIRLPTEAEWEYAIRAGTSDTYYWGTATASLYAQYQYGGSAAYIAVASKLPNDWGLYDMAGNVSEWCSDWYGAYGGSAEESNPTGASDGLKRVFRGGSWSSGVSDLASSARASALPDLAADTRGFRVVHFLPGE